ncbi:MAG: hypothetical protein ABIW50_04365 [Candidatus Limnocylindria bacterium]
MSGDAARRIARALDRRGLTVPAGLLLDAHRPLAPLLSDLGVALAPILTAAAGPDPDTLRLLRDEAAIERIIDALEERHAEPR